MLVARLICSDPACAEEAEDVAASVEELATLACHCGCGLELLAVSEEGERPVVVVREREELLLLAA